MYIVVIYVRHYKSVIHNSRI